MYVETTLNALHEMNMVIGYDLLNMFMDMNCKYFIMNFLFLFINDFTLLYCFLLFCFLLLSFVVVVSHCFVNFSFGRPI